VTRTERIVRVLCSVLAGALLISPLLVVSPAGAKVPRAPFRYGAKIEQLAGYQPQQVCSPFAKAGTSAFANMLLRTYPSSRSLGIVRSCSVGGSSEHKEGRAFDWGVSAYSATDRANVAALMQWLLKTDRYGNRHAVARRLGIQYMIWNRRIWGAYSASSGWRAYTGASPHTDHVHFSLSWAGARKLTSYWKPGRFSDAPGPRPPAPKPPAPPAPKPPAPPAPKPQSMPEPKPPRRLLAGPELSDERVTMPANRRGGVFTRGSLQAGEQYLVEVSGTIRHGRAPAAVADAECSNAPRSQWQRDRSVHRRQRGSDHLDVYLNGDDLLAESDNGDECDTDTHVYRWVYEAPRDGRARFQVWDPNSFTDNRGSLRIRVTELDVREEMTWRVPADVATGATSPGLLEEGRDYEVTVRGTWDDGDGVTADAECSVSTTDATWRRDRSADGSGDDHFDVLFSGMHEGDLDARTDDLGGEPLRDYGDQCDTTGHAYSFVWEADDTEALNLRVQDPKSYADNSGALSVSVTPYVEPAGPHPETVEVDSADATGTETGQSYRRGTRLRLTVSGIYAMRDSADWLFADAECTIARDDQVWRGSDRWGTFNGRYQALGDLAVDGRIDEWEPRDGRGSCDERDHVYTRNIRVERNGPLSFVVADSHYDDNRGTLRVEVEER